MRQAVYSLSVLTAILLNLSTSAFGITIDKVIASVNNDLITLSDYQKFAIGMGEAEKKDKVDEELLNKLIAERIILQEAIKLGITASDVEIDKEIKAFKDENALSQKDLEVILEKEGMNIQTYREHLKNKLISLKLIYENVDSKIVVTEKEISDYYSEHKDKYLITPEKVELKAIFLRLNNSASAAEITELKRTALKISAQLKNDGSFESLVTQYSDKNITGQDGRLGEFAKGELIPPLEKKAFSMKKGEISEPIWVKDGVYILKVINKTPEIFRPLVETRHQIYQRIYETKKEKLFKEWINTLWEKASITIN